MSLFVDFAVVALFIIRSISTYFSTTTGSAVFCCRDELALPLSPRRVRVRRRWNRSRACRVFFSGYFRHVALVFRSCCNGHRLSGGRRQYRTYVMDVSRYLGNAFKNGPTGPFRSLPTLVPAERSCGELGVCLSSVW